MGSWRGGGGCKGGRREGRDSGGERGVVGHRYLGLGRKVWKRQVRDSIRQLRKFFHGLNAQRLESICYVDG